MTIDKATLDKLLGAETRTIRSPCSPMPDCSACKVLAASRICARCAAAPSARCWSGWRHPLKGGCGIKQAAQNFVGHLFRKTHRQFAADLVYNCGCAGNEI